MSDAIGSQGFKFHIGNGDGTPGPLTYTQVKEVGDFGGFDGEAKAIEVTHTESTAAEFIMGVQNFGSWKLEVNHLPGDDGQNMMRAAKASREKQDFKCEFSDGSTATFQGYVLSNARKGGVDNKLGGSFNILITGDVTEEEAGS